MSKSAPSDTVQQLLDVMVALRTPVTGCPWDLEQTFESIAPYTIEEAYEVADAIERGDRSDLKDELGDLLLQVVYHARIAEEESSFTFADVVAGINEKMVRRHPHVFGADKVDDASAMRVKWEDIKAEERALKAAARGQAVSDQKAGTLDDVPLALPALTRGLKLQKKAARVGFDWSDPKDVLAKVREEADEIEAAVAAGDQDHISEEIGDLLFSATNLARHLGTDPEQALKAANTKFERRFSYIEQKLADDGRTVSEASLEEMDRLWEEAKSTQTS